MLCQNITSKLLNTEWDIIHSYYGTHFTMRMRIDKYNFSMHFDLQEDNKPWGVPKLRAQRSTWWSTDAEIEISDSELCEKLNAKLRTQYDEDVIRRAKNREEAAAQSLKQMQQELC